MTFEEWLDKWHIQHDDMGGSVGDGWVSILDRLAGDLVALGWDRRVVRIKEKFGALRFYLYDAPQPLRDRIKVAEAESMRTCAKCGAAGRTISDNGWLCTLCDECSRGSLKNA